MTREEMIRVGAGAQAHFCFGGILLARDAEFLNYVTCAIDLGVRGELCPGSTFYGSAACLTWVARTREDFMRPTLLGIVHLSGLEGDAS